VELRSLRGTRRLPVSEFVTDGYRTGIAADELVTRFILPVPMTQPLVECYLQLGRRNALNITRQSLSGQFHVDSRGTIRICRLVDGALMRKPQRLSPVEEALVGQPLNAASIDKAAQVLKGLVDEAIGGRWSAPYKIPVFVDMFRLMMQDVITEQSN